MVSMSVPTTTQLRSLEWGTVGEKSALGSAHTSVECRRQPNAEKTDSTGVIQHDAQLAARDGAKPIQLYLSAGALEQEQFSYFHQLIAFLWRATTLV